MKVSVIIPVYNEEKVIGECVSSLKKQSAKDFEIIVIDDGSYDSTLEILQKFDVRIFKQNHHGPGVARNLGAKHAKGKILVFVDADMTFDSNFLRNLCKPIQENKSNGTFSKEEYVSNWDNIWSLCWNINSNLPPKRRLPLDYPDTQKVFRAILKSEFDKVHGFSKRGYTDDYTLSEKLGYEAQLAHGAIFYHRNPDDLSEAFKQAKWIGKREYKLGIFGALFAFLRASLPLSLIIGVYKSIKYSTFEFVIFKVIYDFGIEEGILEMIFTRKLSK